MRKNGKLNKEKPDFLILVNLFNLHKMFNLFAQKLRKKLFSLSALALSTNVSFLTYTFSISAQVQQVTPLESQGEVNNTNIDDLPDNTQQMTIWQCVKDNNKIAIEVKDVDVWQSMLQKEGWQCQQNLPLITIDKGKFSCTPQENIGILTIFWLEGDNGKNQMKAWFQDLTVNQGLVCYISRTNQFWD